MKLLANQKYYLLSNSHVKLCVVKNWPDFDGELKWFVL